jgi:hypothetical protein
MFETYVSTNPEICAYDCHIASKGAHPEHKKNPNSFVDGSWRFHDYFDGLKVKPKNIPPMLIRPEKSYVETDVEVNGNIIKRQRIDLIMDFTSVKGCEDPEAWLSPTRVRTHIYSTDPVEMGHFFELKYAETAKKWRLKRRYKVSR